MDTKDPSQETIEMQMIPKEEKWLEGGECLEQRPSKKYGNKISNCSKLGKQFSNGLMIAMCSVKLGRMEAN